LTARKAANISEWRQIAIAAASICALVLFLAVPRAHADDKARCQHRIEKAEARLDEAVQKHGERSHQADDARHELNDAREDCWSHYHQWYDGKEHRWHDQHDWDNGPGH
jgi:hypothetical protein